MTRVKYVNYATEADGDTISGAQVEVRDSQGVLATLYDAATGSTEAYSGSNPFSAGDGTPDKVGLFEFFVEPGTYSITVGTGAAATTYPFEAIPATKTLNFGSLLDFATWVLSGTDVAEDGTTAIAEGLTFKASAGATDLTSLSGWIPGDPLYAEHFSLNATPLQDVADYLPNEGGTVLVRSDLSGETGPTFLKNRAITWVLLPGGSVPADIYGATVDEGLKNQPGAGGLGASTRPGTAYVNHDVYHMVTDDQNNQQDSVYYVEGHLVPPSAGAGDTTEFAGYRTVMVSEDGTEAGAGVRGFHGTAIGDGGNGKIRCGRFTAIGYDGHDGLVTGHLVSATRTGVIPTSAGGNGTDEYIAGDAGPYPNEDFVIGASVGPGIRRVIQMMGLNGEQQRPQFGILQSGGNAALMPEVAVIQMHGGGNGVLVRAYDDEDQGTITTQWDNNGRLSSPAYRSSVSNLNVTDDSVVSVALGSNLTGFIQWWVVTSSTLYGQAHFRASASSVANELYAGTNVAHTTGVLAGTTGADGNFTVSIAEGTIYFENRTGATRNVNFQITGS